MLSSWQKILKKSKDCALLLCLVCQIKQRAIAANKGLNVPLYTELIENYQCEAALLQILG